MLLLMWLAGCSLVALASAALVTADGPWLPGLVALMAMQAAVVAGRAARLPSRVTWPAALACVAVGALGYSGADLVVYLGLAAALLLLVDRFAALSVGVAAFVITHGTAGARTLRSATLAPPDPIARDFARVRRAGSPLAVASISVAHGRGPSRRLDQIARELVSCLRVTDVVVRTVTDRVVVVLPGLDDHVALAVLTRAPVGERAGVLLGIATFPEDGPTFDSLKDVARSREQPWPPRRGSSAGAGTDRFVRPPKKLEPKVSGTAHDAGGSDRPAVFFEIRPLTVHLRRAVDLFVLALIAPVVVPLVVLLAIVVKLDSPGPAFVRIRRLGRDGRPFGLLKLRSMTRDADSMREALRHLNTMAWPDFKISEDPRVTRVGRVLRKYSLDELPQLYNVLLGEMTLVGPRPCSVKLADYDLWQSERLDVLPGLVGRWQAEGRGSVDFAERSRLDIRQARSRSIRVNLQLVLATIRSVFASRGAY
jgi:lipopolysaccharide/colanic/teichoic acid biosynthesis glycosyltransferase